MAAEMAVHQIPIPPTILVSVPDAYLTKLDPGLKYRCQILYQLTEINPSICGKIKQNLVIIEGILHIDQLHFQIGLAYLL